MSQQDESAYFSADEPNLYSTLAFEIKSLAGRCLLDGKPPGQPDGPRFLNLGCGIYFIREPGWINADFFPSLRFWKEKERPEWRLDMRYPLNCRNDYWHGIYSEHTIEHLCPLHAFRLICECHRVLKPGAWIRVIVPDLRKHVDHYLNPEQSHPMFARKGTGAAGIRNLTQGWFHRSVWDAQSLVQLLSDAGFVSAGIVEFGKGSDPRLCRDLEERRFESVYAEAKK